MQPQFRQVPPSAGARSTTAVFKPELRGADGRHVAAGSGPNHHDVVCVRHRLDRPEPVSCGVSPSSDRGQRHERHRRPAAARRRLLVLRASAGSSRATCDLRRVKSYRNSQYDWFSASSRRASRRAPSPGHARQRAAPRPAESTGAQPIYVTLQRGAARRAVSNSDVGPEPGALRIRLPPALYNARR